MGLSKLDIYGVRNIQHASIIPSTQINFIVGENASGKSSLLEAIYILARAKSFRTNSIKSVINSERDSLVVSAQVLSDTDSVFQVGIRSDGKDFEIRINQQNTQQRSDLAYALPLQLIHPKSYDLLDSGAQARREFLDWGVFNQDEKFLIVWRRFKKALAQRNALLKTRQIAQLNVWNKELAYYGTIVDSYRIGYLEKLKPIFIGITQYFLKLDTVELKLVSGWDVSKDFQKVLNQDLEKDLRYGFTHSGPHRGDFQLLINSRLAKDFASRGQLKLLILSLKLAQVKLLDEEQHKQSCVIIDDFAAELDIFNRGKLLKFLSQMICQVFVTATELSDFGDLSEINNYKLFHMEHGSIKQK